MTFFNHSLTPDPADATMDMIGNSSGMYGYVKGLLYVDEFVYEMVRFSRADSSYSTISNSSDWILIKGIYIGQSMDLHGREQEQSMIKHILK